MQELEAAREQLVEQHAQAADAEQRAAALRGEVEVAAAAAAAEAEQRAMELEQVGAWGEKRRSRVAGVYAWMAWSRRRFLGCWTGYLRCRRVVTTSL